MMPLLFAAGQHHALDTVSRSLREDEKLLAFLDDIHFCSEPDESERCTLWSKKLYKPTRGTWQGNVHRSCREAPRSCGGWSPLVRGGPIDTTLVSALRSDGSARRRAADCEGVALEAARRRKARTYLGGVLTLAGPPPPSPPPPPPPGRCLAYEVLSPPPLTRSLGLRDPGLGEVLGPTPPPTTIRAKTM